MIAEVRCKVVRLGFWMEKVAQPAAGETWRSCSFLVFYVVLVFLHHQVLVFRGLLFCFWYASVYLEVCWIQVD